MQNQVCVGMSGNCADGGKVYSGLQHPCNCRVSRIVGDKAAFDVGAVSDANRLGGFVQDLVIFGDGVTGF